MNNNDLSLINLSEIRFLTGDTGERENADAMMQERGLLTDKGNPSVSGIAEQNEHYTPLLLNRLSYKLQFRENSFECIRNTYLKMYSEKDYTGMFLLTVLIPLFSLNVFAAGEDIFTLGDKIIRDVYNHIAGISTVLAALMSAIAVITVKLGGTQQKSDAGWAWLKRIWASWAVINGIGAFIAYIQPLFAGYNRLP